MMRYLVALFGEPAFGLKQLPASVLRADGLARIGSKIYDYRVDTILDCHCDAKLVNGQWRVLETL